MVLPALPAETDAEVHFFKMITIPGRWMIHLPDYTEVPKLSESYITINSQAAFLKFLGKENMHT